MALSKKGITKGLIRLRISSVWSAAPVLLANPRRQVFSRRGPNCVYQFSYHGILLKNHRTLSESIHVNMPHCWKSHVAAHLLYTFIMLSCLLLKSLFMDIVEHDNHVHCVIPQRPIVKNFRIHHFLQNLYVACKETIKVIVDLSKLDGHGVRKPVFGLSDKVRFKPVCSATETS